MQIKKLARGQVELSENGSTTVCICSYADVPETADLIVGPQDDNRVLHRPGEYEYANVGVIALETKEQHIGTAELFKITVNGKTCLFVAASPGNLTKEDWDLVDDIDVVIFSVQDKIPDIDKMVRKLIPYVVIGIDWSSEAEVEKQTGLKPIAAEEKIKFSDKDFEAEDPATTLYLLK